MKIRPVDMLTNLKNWPAWDYKGYKLNENEAEPIIKALDNYIWHDIEKEGMPKEDGVYLFKFNDPDDREPNYMFDVAHVKEGTLRMSDDLQFWAISWRKIIDKGEE